MPSRKHTFLLIILIVSAVFSFCNSKTDASEPDGYAAKFVSELNSTDTFLFDLSMKDTSLLRLKRKKESELSLPSLENGFDSVQLRIGFGCALGMDFLIILSNSNQKWTAELSRLDYELDSAENISVSRKIIKDNPKSGWKKLIRQLFELKILTLPDDDDIPHLEKQYPADGCGVATEVATKKFYRVYNYHNPNLYTKEHWEQRNVMQIIRLLANEFDLEKRFKVKDRFMWPALIP
jgi:hypothetical protein